MKVSQNPFELLTDCKHEASVMRVEAYVAMILAKLIERVGKSKSADILGVSKSRVSRLANRTGSGMTISNMLTAISKLGATVDADVEFESDGVSGFSISVKI